MVIASELSHKLRSLQIIHSLGKRAFNLLFVYTSHGKKYHSSMLKFIDLPSIPKFYHISYDLQIQTCGNFPSLYQMITRSCVLWRSPNRLLSVLFCNSQLPINQQSRKGAAWPFFQSPFHHTHHKMGFNKICSHSRYFATRLYVQNHHYSIQLWVRHNLLNHIA